MILMMQLLAHEGRTLDSPRKLPNLVFCNYWHGDALIVLLELIKAKATRLGHVPCKRLTQLAKENDRPPLRMRLMALYLAAILLRLAIVRFYLPLKEVGRTALAQRSLN
jgi:hypothetical protein